LNSGNEDAAIAVGRSIYYPSTYGYPYPKSAENPEESVPASAPFVGGMQRVDVLPNGSLLTVWSNNLIASAAEPRLSVADNLIYTVGLDTSTGVYSLITIDPDTGRLLSSTPYGSSSGDNPLQMVGMISPDGVLYQGTELGLMRVESKAPAATDHSSINRSGLAISSVPVNESKKVKRKGAFSSAKKSKKAAKKSLGLNSSSEKKSGAKKDKNRKKK
jgi:hypothetical protein